MESFFKKSKYILNLFQFVFFFFFFEHLFEINLNMQEFLLWDRFCSQPSLCSESPTTSSVQFGNHSNSCYSLPKTGSATPFPVLLVYSDSRGQNWDLFAGTDYFISRHLPNNVEGKCWVPAALNTHFEIKWIPLKMHLSVWAQREVWLLAQTQIAAPQTLNIKWWIVFWEL